MSDVATTAAPVAEAAPKTSKLMLFLVNLPYFVLYAISIFLVAMTDSDPANAGSAWQWFIPLVALVSIVDGWKDTRDPKPTYLLQQVLHWGTLNLAVFLLFLPEMQSFMNAESHGFVVAFMLGLTAVLSGIHLEWKMALFGAFVMLSAVGVGYLSDNALLLSLIGFALAAAAITLMLRRRPKAD